MGQSQYSQALVARRRRRHLSRLQFALAIIIICVLTGVLIERGNRLMVEAERTNMAQVEGQMRAALGLAVASRVAKGQMAATAGLAASNPMDLLQTLPPNYLGALRDPNPAQIAPGHWYFDTGSDELIYRVSHADAFRTTLKGPARAAFAIRRRYRDADHDGRYDAGDTLYSVYLARVAPFRWITDGTDN